MVFDVENDIKKGFYGVIIVLHGSTVLTGAFIEGHQPWPCCRP